MAEAKPGKGKYKVTGVAAVVRVLDGSERYLYRGAVFDAAQADSERVDHLVGVGLITKVAATSAAEAAAKAEAEKKAAAEAEAAAKAEAEKKATGKSK